MMKLIGYRAWQKNVLEHVQTGSVMIDTAVGPVEYQITGKGPAVIYAHGTPGGYDQGIAFAHFIGKDLGSYPSRQRRYASELSQLANDADASTAPQSSKLQGILSQSGETSGECTFISPSRPGYLRTPLQSGTSPEDQADLYAALLDELGIRKASIIGFSGGGPSALQFAIRHPNRCQSLVMIGAIVQRNNAHERQQSLPSWKRFGVQLSERLLVSDPFLYVALPLARLMPAGHAVAGMLSSGALYYLRKAGYENDLKQFSTIEDYQLEEITAPAFIVHGTKDCDVPFDDAVLLMSTLAKAQLLAISGGDHAAFYTSARTVMPMLRRFLTTELAPIPINRERRVTDQLNILPEAAILDIQNQKKRIVQFCSVPEAQEILQR